MAANASASGMAARRLRKDLEMLQRSENPQLIVRPSEDNVLEWHFVLHALPSDTPYHSGVYHGKILFPPEYPHAPPAIHMVTPSGRLEVGRRLCLSMTDWHPESWNPAWSVETILVGLLSYFISDAEGGYGVIQAPEARRQQFAAESRTVNGQNAEFRTLFPDFIDGSRLGPVADWQERPAPTTPDGPTPVEATLELARGVNGTSAIGNLGAVIPQADNAVPLLQSALRPIPEGNAQARGITDSGESKRHELSEAQGVAPTNSTAASDDSGEAPMECWICRDTSVDEPLIQPCSCRGSMSGVHASCVEQWIRHHRRSAVNDEAPRCSVCHQAYSGCERRPGVSDFLRHLCQDAARHLLRTVVLVVLLVGFQESSLSTAESGLPIWVRIPLIVIFSVAAVHKVIVLTVSLPPHRPPPRDPRLRRFFVGDYQALAMHIAETFATVTILLFWCLVDSLKWYYFLPFGLLSLTPVVKMYFRHPSLACVWRALGVILMVVVSPFIIIWALGALIWRYPQRAIHPLDAGLHIGIAVTVVPLCFACASNVPIVSIMAVHSALVCIGLIELFLVKRWHWHEGPLWWFALQLTALAAYIANALCEFPEGWGKPDHTNNLVLGTSAVWLLSVTGLTLGTNWELCVNYYRTWQHRNGTFTLQSVPAAGAPSRGPPAEGGSNRAVVSPV